MSIFRYRAGPDTLGIGVGNMALEFNGQPIDAITYGPRYNVRRDFAPLRGAAQFPNGPFPIGPTTSLKADGVYMSGSLALQALTDFNKQASQG